MIWKIAKKDFLLNLMTFKFAVGTIVSVVLIAIFMPVLANDYQQRLKAYNRNVADNEAKLGKVKAYKVLTPTIYRSPQILSVFSQGLEKQLSNSAKIEFGSIPEVGSGPVEVNPYLSIFPTFDVLLIFKIVMSLLALLVAYDVVSGERERGTLRLIMSDKVARHQLLLGKFTAGLMTLAIPVTITFIVGLLLLLAFPMVELTISGWARIGLMYLASLIFVSAMYNVSLLFSCLTRRSALSLVVGLFFWVACAVVIPNGSVYLARRIRPLGPKEKKSEQLGVLAQEFRSELRERSQNLPPAGGEYESDEYGPFGGKEWYVLICGRSRIERWKKRGALEAKLKIKYADRLWEVEHGHVSGLFEQTRLAKNLSQTSPTCLYENVMTALAGTDLASFQLWAKKARVHRESLIEYIRARTDNFSSPSYFTPSKEADWIEWERDSSRDLVQRISKKTLPLNLQDLPRFVYPTGVIQNLQMAIPDLTLLVIINIVFFSLSFAVFLKYDVR